MPSSPTPAEVLEAVLEGFSRDFHVSLPGQVEVANGDGTVDVQPLLKRTIRNADGEKETERLPVIPAVPVVWPCAGGYRMRAPLAKGDTVLLVFCDRDPAAWRALDTVADPGDEGLHGLSGAVAIPGVLSAAKDEAGAVTHLVIGKQGGPEIHVDASGVKVGAASADHPMVLGDNLRSWLNGHTHPVSGGGTTTAPTSPCPTSVLSSKHMIDS